MILNYKDMDDLVFLICDKFISDYFVYTYQIPIYSVEKNDYIFLYTDEVIEGVNKMPIIYKFHLYGNSNWNKIKNLPSS